MKINNAIVLLFTLLLMSFITKAQTTKNFSKMSGYTAIPDINFEKALVDRGYDSHIDGQVLTARIIGIRDLDISFRKISNLTGIQDFLALTSLKCLYNKLTNLDLSKNTALAYLDCSNNNLSALDLTQNQALAKLICFNNQLEVLRVDTNLGLTELNCSGNQLLSLDVNKNAALFHLDCSKNRLSALEVSKNKALSYLRCSQNKLTVLDVSQNIQLTYFYYRYNLLIHNECKPKSQFN